MMTPNDVMVLTACLAILGVTPVESASRADVPVRFTNVTAAAGIDFLQTIGDHEMSNIVESAGVGCGFLDYDGDGWLDIYLVNGCWIKGLSDAELGARERAKLVSATDRLYRNRGDGTFVDVTDQAGLARPGFGMGMVVADYDGDGDADIYVTNYGPNFLYRNNGDGTFTDVAEAAGVADRQFGVGAVFLDFDRDGRIDLYVGNYLTYDPEYKYHGSEGLPGPLSYAGQHDKLLRGNGDGTFSDVSRHAGIQVTPTGRAMGVGILDYDADGFVDIFVANDAMENFLFHNKGNGTFGNTASYAGVAYGEAGEATAAMGVEVADYNGDGLLDMFVPDMSLMCLYQNLGKGVFEDVSARSGIARVCGKYVGWGSVFADFDLDGDLDLYISTGGAHRLGPHEDVVLLGGASGRFEDVSGRAGEWFAEKRVGRGVAGADFDNDGDVDVLVTNLNGLPALLRNDTPRRGRHWLGIELAGSGANRDAIGSRVTVKVDGKTMIRQKVSGGSYLSQHDPRIHFGLGGAGAAGRVERAEVIWPDGSRQVVRDVRADQFVTIRQRRAGEREHR